MISEERMYAVADKKMQFNFSWNLTIRFISGHRVHSTIYIFFIFFILRQASYHIWRWLTSPIKILDCNHVGTAVAVLNRCASPLPLCFLRIGATFPELIAEIFNGDRCCLAASARPLQRARRWPEEEDEGRVFSAFNYTTAAFSIPEWRKKKLFT